MPYTRRTTYRRRRPMTTYRRRRPMTTYRKKTTGYRRGRKRGVYNQQLKVQKNRFPGWPEVLYTKLNYFENNFKFALGNLDKLNRYSFRFNSPYDPVMQSYNKSANYFDDYMVHYKYCRVMGAKISLRFANDATNSRQMQFCLIPNSENYPYVDMDDIGTQIRKKMSTWNNTMGSVRRLNWYLPIHTIFGISKQQYNAQLPGPDYDITNGGIAGYNDVDKSAQVDLWYAKIDENGNFPTQCLGTVKITFYCKYYVRIPSKPLGGDIGDEALDDGETIDLGGTIFPQGDLIGSDTNPFPVNP